MQKNYVYFYLKFIANTNVSHVCKSCTHDWQCYGDNTWLRLYLTGDVEWSYLLDSRRMRASVGGSRHSGMNTMNESGSVDSCSKLYSKHTAP